MKTRQQTSLERYLFPAAMLVITLALFACNTTEGVGKDIEAAGDAIEDTARDAKD